MHGRDGGNAMMAAELYDEWNSLTAMFFGQAPQFGNKPLCWAKRRGQYQPMAWDAVADQVRRLAAGLRAIGVGEGDRVVLVAENRPEWLICDLAIMAAGAVTVPAYITNTADDHRHILTDSGAVGAIVSKPALFRRLWPAVLQAEAARFVIAIEPDETHADDTVALHSWDEILSIGNEPPEALAARIEAQRRDDVACLIYTSGTAGSPRGVMQTHGGIMCNCKGAFRLLESVGLEDEVFLSFLPLSHSYEHSCGQFFPLTIGAQIYYAEGIEALTRNLTEVHPTIMTAVPRLYEMMRMRINRDLSRRGGLSQRLFEKAVALGRKRYEHGRLGPIDALQDLVVDRLVRSKVRERFGGRLKGLVSGGAPLNPEIGLDLYALGLPILQGYGQTETSPVVSCNPPGRVKMHTVGPPFVCVEVRIAEDGEILVRGELVMKGYWNDPEATAAALRDGWLHTGDVGHIDEDGYIVITDRKKDIIVNSGGDNIAPAWIEGLLALEQRRRALVDGGNLGFDVVDAGDASVVVRRLAHVKVLGVVHYDGCFLYFF